MKEGSDARKELEAMKAGIPHIFINYYFEV